MGSSSLLAGLLLLLHHSLLITVELVDAQNTEILNLVPFTTIKENSAQGSSVTRFQVISDDPAPSIVLTSTDPPSGSIFFPVIDARSPPNIFNVTIFLEGPLDFETKTLYVLNITVNSYNGSQLESISSILTVQVLNVNEPPQFTDRLASLGETVHVGEDITPLSTLFQVLASDPDSGSHLTYQITKVVPAAANGSFSISSTGAVLAPVNGFSYGSGVQTFVLTIAVLDQFGANCTGSLTISVTPVKAQFLNITILSQSVTIMENSGDNVYVATVSAVGTNVRYQLVLPSPYFWIDEVTGIISTNMNLDLERAPVLKTTSLLVHAFDLTSHLSATATVKVNVTDVNDNDPVCTPANFITTVPETIAQGTTFFTLRCVDPDVINNSISYTLVIKPAATPPKFQMMGSSFQVNDTLDYDSAEMALLNFQYSIDIVVTDSGVPPRSATVPVRITVSPVNEFSPVCQPRFSFSVPENSAFGVLVGTVVATDQDWPQNTIQYSITGGNSQNLFYIDPTNGNLYGLKPLDFEKQRSYSLNIQAADKDQDVDPSNTKTSTCWYTILVQDENDNPPVCNPSYYERIMYSTLSNAAPIVSILCTDVDTGPALQYTITNGNTNDRFFMNGNQLRSRNMFSFDPFTIQDPTTFDIQIEVTDQKFTRMTLVQVTVVPWTTTAPTTTKVTAPRSPVVVTAVQRSWEPDPWFVAVITVTAALLVMAVGLIVWGIVSSCWPAMVMKAGPMAESLIPPSVPPVKDPKLMPEPLLNQSSGKPPVSPPSSESSKNFDGRAKDPVSGRDYLFNSRSGERRWL